MNEERARELVSAAADDVLSAEEQEELGRILDESADARAFAEDIRAMESLFAEVPTQEPPDGLRERILNQLPAAGRRNNAPASQSWLRAFFATPTVRYGFTAAAGALLAVSVYESQRPLTGSIDITELVGTMAPTTDSRAILASHRFHAEGVESRVQLERRGSALLLDIRVDAARPVDIAVDFSGAGVQLDALAQANGAVDSIEIANEVLRLRVRGRRTVTALLNSAGKAPLPGSASIHFDFSSDDDQQTREMLVPGR